MTIEGSSKRVSLLFTLVKLLEDFVANSDLFRFFSCLSSFEFEERKWFNFYKILRFISSSIARSNQFYSYVFFFFFQFNYAVVMVEKTWLFEW